MPKILHVKLAEKPTDLLVFLVDHGPAKSIDIARGIGVDHGLYSGGLNVLREMGLATGPANEHDQAWRATDEGRRVVTAARAEADGVCEDCADYLERERGDLPGLEGAALHIAVGALYGGSACDHVDWTYEDAARAFEALWAQRGRERDRLSAQIEAVYAGIVHIDALHEALGDLSNNIDSNVSIAEVITAVHSARSPLASRETEQTK